MDTLAQSLRKIFPLSKIPIIPVVKAKNTGFSGLRFTKVEHSEVR
jgi:hypothetical protein